MKKPSLRFRKRGRGRDDAQARPSKACIRQQSYCPRPYERKHPIACPTDTSVVELLVLPDQSTKDVKSRLCFLYLFLVSFLIAVLGTLADYSRVLVTYI